MVDDRYFGGPADVAVTGSDTSIIANWTAWTKEAQAHGCPMIAQL
jgi:hypothetical protein